MTENFNVVIFGLKETKSILKSEVENHDKACVDELCQLTAEGKYPFKLKRLGKRVVSRDEEEAQEEGAAASPDGDSSKSKPKNRPLLVCFDKEDHKISLMRNLYKLGGTEIPEYLQKVSVKHDFTPEERERDRDCQHEAKEKNERNLDLTKIYVVRGPPWERKVVAVTRKARPQQTRRESQSQTEKDKNPLTNQNQTVEISTSNGLPGQ